MGEYTIPGFLSGKNYRFTIAGDQPSPTEMQRMQGILQRDEMAYKQEFEGTTGMQIPYDPEAGTAIGRGLERGIPQFQSALGSAAGAAGLEGVSDYLKDAARDRQRATLATNPSVMESSDFRDVRGLSSGLTYVGELIGEQLPLISGTVAATGAGMLAGASAPVAAGLGTILVSYPQLFGSNIQRQEGEVAAGNLAAVDVPEAALTAIGQTALEAASNVLLVGQAGKGLGRALLTNIPAEAATEVGQQVLERRQAGLDLDSEDAYREYLDAGVAGGTLGGVFGGVGALGSRRRTAEEDEQLQLPPPSEAESGQFDDDPVGQRPGPDAGNATIVGTTRITSRGLNETQVSLSDGKKIILPGDATQAEIDAAVNAYRASAQGRTPPPPAPKPPFDPDSVEDAEVVADPVDLGPLPDPAQPITTETLKALGIPEAARTYRRFAEGALSRADAIKQLQSFVDAADFDGRPDLRAASQRTRQFIGELRKAESQPAPIPAQEPTLSEADAFELAAAEADAARAAEAAERAGATPAAKADAAKGAAQGEIDLGPVADPDAVVEEDAVAEPAPESISSRSARDVESAFSLLGSGVREASLQRVADLLRQGKPPTYTRKEAIDAAKADSRQLVVDNPDGSVTVVDVQPEENGPWVGQQPAEPATQPTPSPKEPSPPAATVESEATAASPTQPEFEFEAASEAAPKPPTSDQDYAATVRNAYERGISTPASVLVEDAEIAQRRETLRDTTATPPTAPTPQMAGATPGAELGTAGQTIPAPVAPAVRPTPQPTRRAVARVPEDPAVNRALENRIAERFTATASPELRAQTQSLTDTAETMPTTAKDKTAVLKLLENPPKKTKGKVSNQYYAYAYFKNYPDVGTALHAIASDLAALGESSVPKFRSAESILGGELMSKQLKVDLEVYTDTGTEPAKRAAAWAGRNLSPETIVAMNDATKLHRPRDYAAALAKADEKEKKRKAQREAERAYRESITDPGESIYDDDFAADFGLAQEDLSYIDDSMGDFRARAENGPPLHPRVVQYLREGNLMGALRNLRITASDKYAGRLADKMRSMLGDTEVQLVPEATMARIEAAMRPGRTPDPRGAAMGVYIPTMTPEAIADARRQGRDEAIDIAQQYGGSVLLNETSGLDATTLLHEASHAVLDRVTRNPSHPLTRQLMTLMSKIVPHTPPGFNGAENLQEFIAEGLTNPEFRREMSRLNPDGAKFSAWEMFTNRIKNFLRRLLGMDSKPLGSATDVIDRALDTVIAANPADRGAGDIMGSSFRPLGARKILNEFKDRVKEATPADMQEVRNVLRDRRVNSKFKENMIWLSMPLDYIGDAAKRYFPDTARTIPELVNEHKTAKRNILDKVVDSLAPVNEWIKTNLEKIDTFNDVRFTATRFGADPRKKRSDYEGFSYKYDRIDPASGEVVTEVSSRYKTRDELNAAMRQHDRAGIPGHSEASVDFAQDPDQLNAFDEVMRGYNSLGPAGRKAMDTLFAIPEALTKNLAVALKSRLEALLPQDRALQERIYGKIYDKVFNGTGVTPYQTLSRTGDYALSYYGADPKKVQLDEDGDLIGPKPDVQYFTHSFQTSRQRDIAIRLLQSQPPAFQIDLKTITPYQQADARKREKMSDQMVGRLLSSIDAAGLDSSVRDSIIEMVLDTAPESSFMQMFRARKGTRGFVGDITPLEQELTPGDTLANIRDNTLRLAGNIVDIEYGAKFAKAKQELTKEYQDFAGAAWTDPIKRGQDVEEARVYYDALTSYASSAFRRQGELAQTLTTGAWAMTLAANVSSALLVLTSLPIYAFTNMAPIHGVKSTMQALGHAGRMLMGSGTMLSAERITSEGQTEGFQKKGFFFDISVDNLDTSDPNSKFGYMKAFQDAGRINGLFGRSLLQDLTAGENVTGRFATAKKVIAASGVMQSTLERGTREVTGIAKYHLALQKLAKDNNMGDFSLKQVAKKLEDGSLRFTDAQYQEAAKEAMNVAEKTNGPMYAAASTQAAQSDLGNILMLYKRHSLSMYNLLYQTMTRSLPTKAQIAAMPESERAAAREDVRIARLQLGGMMGVLATLSGALGLPLVQQLGWIYDAFADDDEEDFKTMTRTAIGEYGAYGLLDYLSGVRVSERIGLGAPFYRAGLNSEGQPPLWRLIEGVGGPVVGLTNKYMTRVPELFAAGDIQRGTEALMPSAVANLFRAARYSQEGIRTRRGDLIIDDISPASVLAQAVGFMPAAYARQLDQNAALSRIDNAIRQERSKLLSMRYQAFSSGDRTTFREVEQEIAEFNRRHPGDAEITPKTKEASLTANMKTTDRMHHGVNLSDQNIRRTMELASQYGPATIWE